MTTSSKNFKLGSHNRNPSYNLQEMKYLHNFNNQELQCYPDLLSVQAEQETLVRSVTNKATYTEFIQNSDLP